MTLEEALTKYLLADSGLTALIGQRLYPDDAIPQGNKTWPVLTYRQTGSDPVHYLTGERSALERDSYDLTAHSPDRRQCSAVRDRLKAILSGTACRGTWGGGGGVVVRAGLFRDVDADDQPPTDGDETRARTVRVNLTIIWVR